MPILLIAIGGAAGAVTRYAMDLTIATRLDGAFPWGTFAVNLTGSFALGVLFALVVEREFLPAGARAPLMIGFLGAFTTFSTFSWETFSLIQSGSIHLAAFYVILSLTVALIGVLAGAWIGTSVFST